MRSLKYRNIIMLPYDFTPSSQDIICGKGKDCYDHIGNKLFRHIVSFHIDEFIAAKDNKSRKSKIVSNILFKLQRHLGRNNGFVSRDRKSGNWCQLCTADAKEKIGYELRRAVANRKKKAEKTKMLALEAQKFRQLYKMQQEIVAELKAKSDMEMEIEEDEERDEIGDPIQYIMGEENESLDINDTDILFMLGI